MNISIVIPTYNEEENILDLIKSIKENLSYDQINYQIIIVDDSLDNNILNILKNFTEKIKYIHRAKKLGRGSAVLEGIKFSLTTKFTDLIIEMDADLSHNPNEFKQKIEFFKNNKCDLLISSRYTKNSEIIGWPYSRKLLSFFSNKFAKFFLSIPVSDYTNGFRFYSKPAAKHVTNFCGKIGDGFIVLSEILLELYLNKFKICETDTIFKNRTKGTSTVSLKLIIYSMVGLLKLYFIKIKKKGKSQI